VPFDPSVLPEPSPRRIAVRVTPDALRQIRGGHPWVYDGSITSRSHDGSAGDLAVIFDERRAFAAIGLWDPESPIRIKIIHVGRPTDIDREFWLGRISHAIDMRRPLIDDPANQGVRLLHGENDHLPGLVLDTYAGVGVLKLYTTAWLAHLEVVSSVIRELVSPSSLIVRFSRNIAHGLPNGLSESSTLFGPAPAEPVMFLENGLSFEAHPLTGQKTGHFLDQRDNRQRVREIAGGARVLDVFSCTGGFSVHAAAGGATEVHSVDIAPEALRASARNMAHNRSLKSVAACRHMTTTADAFETMAAMADRDQQYDLVIVDPPSFAQRQSNTPAALRAYARLTSLALRLVTEGGILVQASCSSRVSADEFHRTVEQSARTDGFRLDIEARTGHCLDHPIGFAHGAYLKAVFARVSSARP